ncbi:unnamed protein product [Calicophoron daubneyi]|uniref:RNA polymerase I-specific transcription initiation factor RRN3 n=1 Tax=Calicophoron daubneyi TaxID=300641 RepID=A0AAV2TEX0_CALDB
MTLCDRSPCLSTGFNLADVWYHVSGQEDKLDKPTVSSRLQYMPQPSEALYRAMDLDDDSDLSNIAEAVRKWNSDDFPSFASCVTKLLDPQSQPSDALGTLLRSLQNAVYILPVHLAKQLCECFYEPHIWTVCGDPVPAETTKLLLTLSAQFPCLLFTICNILLRLLFPKPPCGSSNLIHCCSYQSVVKTFLKGLLSAVPQAETVLVDQMIQNFPNWRKPTAEILIATYNTFHLISTIDYCSLFSDASKQKLVAFLCEFTIELELNPENCAFVELNASSVLPTGLEYTTDPVGRKCIADYVERFLDEITPESNKHWIKLEMVTWLILSHMHFVCSCGATERPKAKPTLNWNLLCSIYRRLRDIFTQHIIPVRMRVVAFPLICFYVCSLRKGLPVSFSESLWNSVKDVQQDIGTRINALSYLTWGMARLKCFFADLVIELLVDMTSWCIDYAYQHRNVSCYNCKGEIGSENSIYHAVCGSVFYSIVQLHAILLDSKPNRMRLEHLPLAQIKLSHLSPWSNMLPELRWAFREVASTYKISCYPLGFSQPDQEEPCLEMKPETLEQVKPGEWFSLFSSGPSLTLSQPFLQSIVRRCVVGKQFTSGNPVMTRKFRASLKRHRCKRAGVDVSKFACIVKDV